MAIDLAVGQPRLGAGDGPLGILGRLPSGQFADDARGLPFARADRTTPPAASCFGGQIEKRRQRRSAFDDARRDELRDRQKLHVGLLAASGA